MYQIFQKCNRQRQSSDCANAVGRYDDSFRKRYSTSHKPNGDIQCRDADNHTAEYDTDDVEEFADDHHIVIDVWPPTSVSAEVTWNKSSATCTAPAHDTQSYPPVYSSTRSKESFDDNCHSRSRHHHIEKQPQFSPDTRWSSDVRWSPSDARGCSDSRFYDGEDAQWSSSHDRSFAPHPRNEPSTAAVSRWFPEPRDDRLLTTAGTPEPPDTLWSKSSPSSLLPSDNHSFTHTDSAPVPPSTFYSTRRQTNVNRKSGVISHSDKLRNQEFKKNGLVVDNATSSDSDITSLNRRPLHCREQGKESNLSHSRGKAPYKGAVCMNESRPSKNVDSQSVHPSNVACVKSASSLVIQSSPMTVSEDCTSRADDAAGMSDEPNNVSVDKACDLAISVPLQPALPCQDVSRAKQSARKSTGGGYRRPVYLTRRKFLALTPDRKRLTTYTLKEPSIVLKKVCTSFPMRISGAPKCNDSVMVSHSKSAPSGHSVVPDFPKSIPSDHSLLVDCSKLVHSDCSGIGEHLALKHPMVTDSCQLLSGSPTTTKLHEPLDAAECHHALSGSPFGAKQHTQCSDLQSPEPILHSSRQETTSSVIDDSQQLDSSIGSVGSNLEQIVQHLKRRAESQVEDGVLTKKRRWNRMPPCSALADPLPPFPTSCSSARQHSRSARNKHTFSTINDKKTSSDAMPFISEHVTSPNASHFSEPAVSNKVPVIQGEYAITHINGSSYMALEDQDKWHLQADSYDASISQMHFSISSLEVCTQASSDGAWTKCFVDAEVQAEAVTPAGYDKEVLDSYIKAKLDESLAKELNIKLQHMKKQIDRVLQEKERLEKAHKNTILKIQSLMRTTLKPSVADKSTSTIGLTPDLQDSKPSSGRSVQIASNSESHDVMAANNSLTMKTRKKSVGIQCAMLLTKQRKRTCAVQTEGLITLDALNCAYAGKQKGPTTVTVTVPKRTVSRQPEEVSGEPLSIDRDVIMLEPPVSTAKSVTTVHKWLATETTNSCARCIMVNPIFVVASDSICARSRPHSFISQTALENPIHQPPTCGIVKALWMLQLLFAKLPIEQRFVDRFTVLMASLLHCTSGIFQNKIKPTLAEPVLQTLEHCGKNPGLASYILGQKLQELCNLLKRLCKLRHCLTPEFSTNVEALYKEASETLDMVKCPQDHTLAKDDDPLCADTGGISCSIVSSPVGSDMESDSSDDDDMDLESSESSCSDSETSTPESSARTAARVGLADTPESTAGENKGTAVSDPSASKFTGTSEMTAGENKGTAVSDPSASKFTGTSEMTAGGNKGTAMNNPSTAKFTRNLLSNAVIVTCPRQQSVVNTQAVNDHTSGNQQLLNQSQLVLLPNAVYANPDKINLVLQQLCKQLYESHQRMIASKKAAANGAIPSTAQQPKTTFTASQLPSWNKTLSNSCVQGPDIPVLPLLTTTTSGGINSLMNNPTPTSPTTKPASYLVTTNPISTTVVPNPTSISVTTNSTSISVETNPTSTTVVPNPTSISVATNPTSTPIAMNLTSCLLNGGVKASTSSGVKVTICNPNNARQITSAISVLSRAVGLKSTLVLPGTVMEAVNEIFNKTVPQQTKTGSGGAPSAPIFSKTIPKHSQSAYLEPNKPLPLQVRTIPPKSGSAISSLSPQSVPGIRNSSSVVPPAVVLEAPAVFNIIPMQLHGGNSCVISQENNSSLPSTFTISRLMSTDCQQKFSFMPTSSIVELQKIGDVSNISETMEKTQQDFNLSSLSSEHVKTIDTSKISETQSAAEKCQQDSSLMPSEHLKPINTSKILSETENQHDSNLMPLSSIEHLKPVDASTISAEKCQQNSSLMLLSSNEHSKTVDALKISSATLSIAENSQQNSSSTAMSSVVECSEGVESCEMSQMPFSGDNGNLKSAFESLSPAVGYSDEFIIAAKESSQISCADGCQQNTVSSVDTSTKIPPRNLPSITLPLAPPLVGPNTTNKYPKKSYCTVQQDLPLSSMQHTYSLPGKSAPDIPVKGLQEMPLDQESHVPKTFSLVASLSSERLVPTNSLPVCNATTCHQTTVVSGNSHEQCTSQALKTASLPAPSYLKLFANLMPEGIVIKWTFVEEFLSSESQVANYELFVRIGKEQVPFKNMNWVLLGRILPLPLPMAVTLTNFVQGECYTFLVKALLKGQGRQTLYSNAGRVQL